MPVPRAIIEQIKQLIPPLNGTLHKGQSGRVGVLGGALDYTGAPFFASFSALRLGADLSHVICSPTAAPAIKSYSPDLIVHPILCEDAHPDSVTSSLRSILSRLHVLVVGPGLGREQYMKKYARSALSLAVDAGMYIVLDADALIIVGETPSIIRGYRKAVLTPNLVEFKRLCESLGLGSEGHKAEAGEVSKALGGVTILEKGAKDVVAVDAIDDPAGLKMSKIKAEETIEVDIEGGMKRCGGQGDILSGCVGTILAWGKCYEDGAFGDKSLPITRIPLLAAIGGSMVTRTASRRGFLKEGRSVVTEDMLPEIGKAFSELFGDEMQSQDRGRL